MAKKGGSDQPGVPDPVATANAQSSANKDTAITQQRLNQINEITPYGTSTYSPTGQTADGVDLYQRTTTLAPSQQRQLDLQNGLQEQLLGAAGPEVGRINDIVSQPFNYDGLPSAPVENDAARQQVQDALYARNTAILDPQYDQRQKALETSLANQGFSTNAAGYRQAMDDFTRQRDDAYAAARNDAVTAGGSEQSRLFGLDTTARNNAISERTLQRSQPINELATLLGQAGGVATPQFSAPPQTGVANTDVAGITQNAYANQTNADNQQQQQNNSLMGSLFGLGGSALGAWLSDPEAKTDVRGVSSERVLSKVEDMPVPSWRYRGDSKRRIGPMADDFAKAFGGDGHSIDGATAFGVSLAAIKELASKVGKLERRAA